MPLTASWTLIPVTGQYRNRDGSVATGSVTFASSQVVIVDGEIIVPAKLIATLDSDGAFSIELPSTNDPDLDVTGWAYSVRENIPGLNRDPFSIFVEFDGGPIDLAEVSPVVDPGEMVGTVTAAQLAALAARVAALEDAPEPVADHGGLTGLGDDDHLQYLNNARGDARYDGIGAATAAQAAAIAAAAADATTKANAAQAAAVATASADATTKANAAQAAAIAASDAVGSAAAAQAFAIQRANHTGSQLASTISDFGDAARAVVLTGLSLLSAADVSAADTVLVAIGKLQAQSSAQATSLANKLDASAVSAYGLTLIDDANAAAARTTLGLGTLATQSGTFSGVSSGTNTGDQTSIVGITGTLAEFNAALTGADFATGGGTVTGASSGTNTGDQDLSAYLLSATAAATYEPLLALGANTFRARASAGVAANKTITDFGLSLVDDADAAAARTTLGLGTLATQSGTFSGTSSGINTGDQTITLTGDVTGTGTGSFAATLATAQPAAHTWALAQTFTVAPVFTDAAGSRTALGATTVGSNLYTLANPGAITFIRLNADNTVTTRSAANFKADLSLDNVTNNAQTQAAVVPNTAPSAGALLVGNAGGTAYAMVAVTGDVTLASTGATTLVAAQPGAHTWAALQTLSLGASIASAQTLDWNSDAFLSRKGAANLRLGAADAAAPVAQTLSAQGARGGTDNNTAAVTTTIVGSLGTGTGTVGDLVFSTGTVAASGTAAHTAAARLTLNSTAATFTAQVRAPAGSASTPGLTVANNPSSGFYDAGGVIAHAISGTTNFYYNSGETRHRAAWCLNWTDNASPAGGTLDFSIARGGINTVIFGAGSALAGAVTSLAGQNKTVSAIPNNTATAVLTFTVPNAAHTATFYVRLCGIIGAGGAIGAHEAAQTAIYEVTITRTAGVNAVANAAAIVAAGTVNVAGATTVTTTAAMSAVSGAVGASNTFTLNVTIARAGGTSTNHICLVRCELLNANATGITVA